jgi:hypothetical protein
MRNFKTHASGYDETRFSALCPRRNGAMDVPNLKLWLIRCGWLAGFLMLLSAVSGSLWGGLSGLGDAAGAAFFQGMFWGTLVCFAADALVLVGLLTWHVLNENPETHGEFPPK